MSIISLFLFQTTILFIKRVYSTNNEVYNNPKSLYTLAFEIEDIYAVKDINEIKINKFYKNLYIRRINDPSDYVTRHEYSQLKLGTLFRSEKKIDFSNLDLSAIPLYIAKQMEDVEELSLSHNSRIDLSGEWFTDNFRKIKHLSLSDCNLNIKKLASILKNDSLPILESLDISENYLDDLSSLTEDMENKMTIYFRNLKTLNLSKCSLDEKFLEILLKNCPSLECLNISLVSKIDLSNLSSNLPENLKELDLSTVYDKIFLLTESLNGILDKCKKLEKLNLANNTYFNFKKLKPLPESLKELDMTRCHLSQDYFKNILNNCINLEILKIRYNQNLQFTESVKLPKRLTNLDVCGCRLSKKSTEFILNHAHQFTYLDFSDDVYFGNLIDENIRRKFNGSNLKVLKINDRNTKISDLITFLNFENLEELELSSIDLICTEEELSQLKDIIQNGIITKKRDYDCNLLDLMSN